MASHPTELQLGIYRHWKGPLYLVLGLAHDANADQLGTSTHPKFYRTVVPLGERTVVVYVPLQLDGAHLGPRMAVRTLEDFQAQVCQGGFAERCTYWGEAPRQQCHDQGHVVSRFSYLGAELTAQMMPDG